jgi:hypothetical protein
LLLLRSLAAWVATILLVACLAPGCGARTSLPGEQETDEPTTGATSGDAGPRERVCLPNCTIGHQCCIGGCGGPPAPTATGCCECFPGEVNSNYCEDGRCE